LFDGKNPESQRQYDEYRAYIRNRCRYAAAFLERLRNPQVRNVREELNLVDRWGDQQLESFFQEMIELLMAEHPLGQMLLYDLPNNAGGEILRLQTAAAYLGSRPERLLQGMLQLPGPLKTIFDASTMDKLRAAEVHSCVGVLHSLQLSREGSLTCPVAAGVVLAGVLDYGQLKDKSGQEVAEALQEASQQPVCLSFNSLRAVNAVEDHAGHGLIPPILWKSVTHAGILCEFDTSWNAVDYESALRQERGKLIKWVPLLWFKFHSPEEALQVPGAASQQEYVEFESASVQDDQNESSMSGSFDALSEEIPPSSEEEDESVDEGDALEEHFVLFHEAIEGVEGEDFVVEDDDFTESDRTAGRNKLTINLCRPIVANTLMVKLIDQEDLMNELNDPHTWPNIDMQSILVKGMKLDLPPGLHVKP
jgi:hypothetical protein